MISEDYNDYVIFYILMCDKSERLSNFPIRRVNIYSIYTYICYVYVEVYANLQVEEMKSFKFSAKFDL